MGLLESATGRDCQTVPKRGYRKLAMKRLVCYLFVLTVSLIGCSLPVKRNPPSHKFGKTYDIGVIHEANTGETMITVCSRYMLPSYRIRYEYKPSELPALTPDQEWVAYHTLEGNYIVTTRKYPYRRIFGIEIKPNGELASEKPWIQLYNNKRPMQEPWRTSDNQVFVPLEGYVLHDHFFKAELIYSGITQNTIHISYREFANYQDRPALDQELSYDLKESDQITFRSLEIRVVEANNAKIKFQVLDDGGLPWVPREKPSQR